DDSATTGGFPNVIKKSYAIPAALILIIALGISLLYFNGNLSRGAAPPTAAVLSPSASSKRIVILPFTGSDPNATTLGSGIADALSQKLGSIKAFEIVSANSGRAMASRTDAEIRGVLKANYALRGTISLDE